MDVRSWSKEFIIDLIDVYKSYPCLWKVKSREYQNRNLRHKAYVNIVQFCKQHGFPNADRDFVAKKIQSMRSSFRKELKKKEDFRCSESDTEEIYRPTLWYYELLRFTNDQHLPTDSVSNMDDTELKSAIEEEEEYDLEEVKTSTIKQEFPNKSVGTTPELVASRKRPNRKRKIVNSEAECHEISSPTLKSNSQPPNDFDAVGLNVSKKLAKMKPLQAVYAESLINSIIRRGMLKKLIEETDFCNSGCNVQLKH